MFDGNIQKQSWLKANDNILRNYTYSYDASSRLKSALYSSPNKENFSLPKMTYDKNRNILNLSRKANIAGGFGTVDSLSYFYTGNRLLKVEDAVSDTSKNYFNNRSTAENDFEYYSNGNLKKDLNENITQINYNTYLNQPIEVQKLDGTWEKSFYDGSGHLFKRTNSLRTTWTYSGNVIYKNDTLYQIGTPEGRIIQDTLGNYHYQFEYRDLTGNLRLLYQDPTIGNPSVRMAPEIVQSQDYEPFGVSFNEYFGSKTKNRFAYSNHEIVDDLHLNRIGFGNRTYNHTYGRFDKVDGNAPLREWLTPYNYVQNNPILRIDPDGNFDELYNQKGKKIGVDENGVNGQARIVTDKAEVSNIESNTKNNSITQTSSISPGASVSKAGLGEALSVLKRTQGSTVMDSKGGLHGESSIVKQDGTVIKGASGPAAFVNSNNELQANEILPFLTTAESAGATSIHSHVTGTILQNGQIYSHDALQPSNSDLGTFKNFKTNIIVGPLGQATATSNSSGGVTVNQNQNGAAIYKGGSSTPAAILTQKAIQKIIK